MCKDVPNPRTPKRPEGLMINGVMSTIPPLAEPSAELATSIKRHLETRVKQA